MLPLRSEPRAPDHAFGVASQRCRPQGLLLLERREGLYALSGRASVSGREAGADPPFPLPASQKDEVYLNLVLEFIPETVYRASRHYAKLKQTMPMIQIKVRPSLLFSRSFRFVHER
jgi:hypothetical protein